MREDKALALDLAVMGAVILPGSNQIGNCEQSAQENTHSADNHISDSHERILPTKSRPSRK